MWKLTSMGNSTEEIEKQTHTSTYQNPPPTFIPIHRQGPMK